MKKFNLLVLVGVGALFLSATSQAGLIRITPEGVAVPDQPVTHPVPITDEGFRLTYHSNGAPKPILDPLLLIFATPDGGAPILTASGPSNPSTLSAFPTLGGTNVYGGIWDPLTGSAGTFGSTDSGSVYAAIGLGNAGGSQNYSNWNGTSGITSWDLWVYTITFDPDIERSNWFEFSTSNFAVGSFVVGYGCTKLNTAGDACRNPGATEDTPFTYAGYVVPEPASLILFGIGLLGLGWGRARLGHRS